MSGRSDLISGFLAGAGWGDASRSLLAGDASNRRYDRLERVDGACAVLMDADPSRGESVGPFVAMALHLRAIGLSAPAILAQDAGNGLLLLEDLGDGVFASLLRDRPELETSLYEEAIDALCALQSQPAPPLERLDAERCADLAKLVFDWYCAAAPGADPGDAMAFEGLFRDLCAPLDDIEPVLMLRDFHAENLIWLPERTGVARVGLLDFQDAMLAHPAYDLVSILQDARRDLAPGLEDAMIARFALQQGLEPELFRKAYAVLGVQRQLRILGIFARLSMRDGKTRYIDFVPRVWAHLRANLAHPALAAIAPLLDRTIPDPTPDHLARLRTRCTPDPMR